MAHLLGISKSSLVNKENGRTEFLKSEAMKFAEIVGMPEDEIDFSCSDRIKK
jgi:DNA-binding XRE family transcriptional regulator